MRNDKIRRFRPRQNKFRSRRHNNNGLKNNGIVNQVNNQRNSLSRINFNKIAYLLNT